MAKARFQNLLEKSISAAISAIEIYNKPDFKYREETFAILMMNAWETLLKAKILKDNKNKLQSIYVPEKTKTKDGKPLKRFYPKINRAGNPLTIEINWALEKLNLDKKLKENIRLLIEIRDNAIHFMNNEKLLGKKVLEIGTANLKSFVQVFNDWFDYSLKQYNFYLMPISFFHGYEIESFSINSVSEQNKNLLQYIAKKELEYPSDEESEHNISLRLATKFEKSSDISALNVKYSNDANITVKVDSEDTFGKKYPWNFETLSQKLKSRYSNWSKNNKFWNLKRNIEKNKKYSDERFLDYQSKKWVKKRYYSTEILKEFDRHYEKKP